MKKGSALTAASDLLHRAVGDMLLQPQKNGTALYVSVLHFWGQTHGC